MIIRAIGLWLLAVMCPLCAQTITVQGQNGGSVEVSVTPADSAVVLDGKLCVVAGVDYTFTLTPTNPAGAGWTVVNGGSVPKTFTAQQAGGPAVPIQESSARFKFVRNQSGMAEEESPVTISVTVLKVDVEVENTSTSADDVVRIKTTLPAAVYHATPARARLQPSLNASHEAKIKAGADDRLRLSLTKTGSFSNNITLTFPANSGWVSFYLGGDAVSASIGDAKLRGQLSSATNAPLVSEKAVTVFSYKEAQLGVTRGLNADYEISISGSSGNQIASYSCPYGAITFSAAAKLVPDGLTASAFPLNNINVRFLQNSHAADKKRYVHYKRDGGVVWFSARATPGFSATIPQYYYRRWDLADRLLDASSADYPLSGAPAAQLDGSEIYHGDTPELNGIVVNPPRYRIKNSSGVVVGIQRYVLDRIEINGDYTTYCSVYDSRDGSSGTPTLIKQGGWRLNVSSNNENQMAVVLAQNQAVASGAVVAGDSSNTVGNQNFTGITASTDTVSVSYNP